VSWLTFVILKDAWPADQEAIRDTSGPWSWVLVQGLVRGPHYVVYSAGGFLSEEDARREVDDFKQLIWEAPIEPGYRDITEFPPSGPNAPPPSVE